MARKGRLPSQVKTLFERRGEESYWTHSHDGTVVSAARRHVRTISQEPLERTAVAGMRVLCGPLDERLANVYTIAVKHPLSYGHSQCCVVCHRGLLGEHLESLY